jgi:hypothetical protein
MTRTAITIGLAAALAGCGFPAPTSRDVSTRDIGITLDAKNEGDGTLVNVDLTSPLDSFTLVDGDALQITAGGVTRAITEDPVNLGDVSGPLVVDLIRPHDPSARGLRIDMPPPFTVTAPPVTATQPIELTWDEAEGVYAMDVAVSGSCINPILRNLSQDLGTYVIQPAELSILPTTVTPCPLTITVRRFISVQGPVLPTGPSGHFYAAAEQRRTIQLSWSWGP